jgi:peptidoglycan/xylan/chitin deacetylase (PgdA/CDA1 family)
MSNPAHKPGRPDGWPTDRPLAVSVSVMLEGWTDDSAPGLGPMGNPLKAGVLDTQARSWAEYGPKTGAWRLLDVLDSCDVKAVVYSSGILAERYPELMRAIVQRGHILAAHAWAQNIVPACQTNEEEEVDLKRTLEALERYSGVKPAGWISPRATPSTSTPQILARHGVRWYADAFDQDIPYKIPTDKEFVVAIPFTVEVNDVPLCVRYGNEPNAFVRILSSILEGWSTIGNPLGCLDITAHAHVFGRPAGAIAFKRAIELAKVCRAVWVTNHSELSDLYTDGKGR